MGTKVNFGVEMAKVLPAMLREVTRRNETIFTKGGLELTHIIVLDALRIQGTLTMGELASVLNMSMGAVTGIIDRMIEKGLVKRERCTEDRRVVRVALLAKGKTEAQQVNQARVDMTNDMFSALSENERLEYLRLINKVYESLR